MGLSSSTEDVRRDYNNQSITPISTVEIATPIYCRCHANHFMFENELWKQQQQKQEQHLYPEQLQLLQEQSQRQPDVISRQPSQSDNVNQGGYDECLPNCDCDCATCDCGDSTDVFCGDCDFLLINV